jgi:hypothetical protein
MPESPEVKHFVMSAFNNGNPFPIGSVAKDSYDPTYGGGGVTVGADLFECNTCGVPVLDWRKHEEWHNSLTAVPGV